MTTIYGQFHDVIGRESIATISFRSIRTREGYDQAGMITTEAVPITLQGGVLPDTEVDPGTTVVTLEGAGVSEQWVIDTPTEGRHDIAGLVEAQYDYEPAVVSQAVAARDEAIRQATAAAASAQTATEQASHVDEVVADGAATVRAEFTELTERAETAATKAEGHETAAEGSATTAGTARDDAQTAQTAAEDAQAEAEKQATAASESAAYADDRAAYSEKCANTSRSYNDTAWTARQNAITARNEAKQAVTDAEAQANAAASSASYAQDAATNAASEVRDELADLTGQATMAAAGAKTSASNAKTSEDTARKYAEAAGEAVASGSPDATDTTKGKVKLAGDLGGTADAPTVPGLADKADTGHTHALAEVAGAEEMKAKMDAATYQPTGGALVQRGSDGTASFAVPTGSNHAATKGYVDSAKSSAFSQAKTYTDSRIVVVASEDEVGSEAGVLYVVAE